MRIAELHLKAFGPFDDVRVDLDAGGPGLHVIYGHNEAGKSTTLRALFGLFFGIPPRTTDAHRHRMPKLRIGARLVDEEGAVHELLRKKGNKNTLLGPDEQPIDEAVMQRLLAHVSEQEFARMFGLDHETLREGAAELLSSGGDVGQSLYGASLGGGIHTVVTKLDEEADAIFTARGKQKKTLNAALAEYKEAQRRVRDAGFTPEGYKTQVAALEGARTTLEHLEAQRAELHAERYQVERALRVIPLLKKLVLARQEREALGTVIAIAPESVEARARAEKAADEARRTLDFEADEVARLQKQRHALPPRAAVAEVPVDVLSDLADRFSVHRKDDMDLRKREAERDAAAREAERIVARVRPEAKLTDARTLIIQPADRAALAHLADAHGELVSNLANARDNLDAALAEREEITESAGEVGSDDTTELTASLEAARDLGDAPTRLAALRAELAAKAEAAERRAKALPGFEGSAAEAAGLRVPDRAQVDRDVEARRECVRAVTDARAKREERAAELAALESEIEEEARKGAVPTERDLEGQRRDRDRLWAALRRSMEDDADERNGQEALGLDDPDPEAYEDAVARADGTSDAMRREADRVAKRARLETAQREAARALARAEERLKEAEATAKAHDEATRARWRSLGVEGEDAEQMRAFHARHAELVAAWELVETGRAEEAALAARVEEVRARLAKALGGGAERDLRTLARAAEAATADAQERRVRREADRERRNRLSKSIEALERKLAKHQAALEAWKDDWKPRTLALGLGESALPAEAREVIGVLVQLERKLDQLDALQDRIDKMGRDAARFAEDLDRLVASHAPDLADRPLDERAAGFIAAVSEAHAVRDKAAALDDELGERGERVAQLEAQRARAEQELHQLCEAAGVADLEALHEAEARSRRAKEIDATIDALEADLLEAGEGEPLASLQEQTEGLDLGRCRGRKADIDREIEELMDRVDDARHDLREKEGGLARFREDVRASEAAEEAQSVLARVQEEAHRYVRLRLAATVLRAEIARYRDENQGPILDKANAFFPRLTRGAYSALRTGMGDGDEPVLRCVRADGEEVGVEALSDGTKDQLYLALRLATLLDFANRNGPLPLILDDCLVHFDDDRARAALEVLGEVSKTFQILFFTHHARLLELAREAVPEDRLHVRDLNEARRAAEARP